MFNEKNSGPTFLHRLIFILLKAIHLSFFSSTKGGGSANKTFLYQQTKINVNEESLTKFVKEKIKDLAHLPSSLTTLLL